MSINKIFSIGAFLTGVLITSSVINCASAKEIAIYRWVDHDNVVHFSQNLPQGHEYTELSTVSSFRALSKEERKAIADGDGDDKTPDTAKQQEMTIEQNRVTYEKNCKSAKLNIKMLNTLGDIHVSEEKSDGTIGSRPLTPAEKTDKLALSKKHVELYCTK